MTFQQVDSIPAHMVVPSQQSPSSQGKIYNSNMGVMLSELAVKDPRFPRTNPNVSYLATPSTTRTRKTPQQQKSHDEHEARKRQAASTIADILVSKGINERSGPNQTFAFIELYRCVSSESFTFDSDINNAHAAVALKGKIMN